MLIQDKKDQRKHVRFCPVTEFRINDGRPFKGGILHDVSAGGAAISYPERARATTPPIQVGQELSLVVADCIVHRSRVVRIDKKGFACKFME